MKVEGRGRSLHFGDLAKIEVFPHFLLRVFQIPSTVWYSSVTPAHLTFVIVHSQGTSLWISAAKRK